MKPDMVATVLYNQAIAEEVYPENPDGESLAILNMLADIRKLGYDYHYLADIKFRKIKDPAIMKLLLQYYSKIDSIVIKGDILRKIDPKRFPEVFDLALAEYNEQSPLDKNYFSDFQDILSKSAKSEKQISLLLSLMDNPDNYASSYLIRQKLAKTVPESYRKYSFLYSKGVLLPATLKEFAKYGDSESVEVLKYAAAITDSDIKELCDNQSYKLCVTMQEYWKKCCTKENIQNEAKSILIKNS